MTHDQTPDSIKSNPRLQKLWTRYHHVLSPAAFDERYSRTLLLPLEWPNLRKQVALLKALIDTEPGIIIKTLVEKSGIKYSRCREILWSREWLEWYCRRFSRSSACHFFPLDDDFGRRLVPEEIRVEYLVAEFERLGFGFHIKWEEGPELRTRLPRDIPAGTFYYLAVYRKEMTEYIRRRDAGFWWDG